MGRRAVTIALAVCFTGCVRDTAQADPEADVATAGSGRADVAPDAALADVGGGPGDIALVDAALLDLGRPPLDAEPVDVLPADLEPPDVRLPDAALPDVPIPPDPDACPPGGGAILRAVNVPDNGWLRAPPAELEVVVACGAPDGELVVVVEPRADSAVAGRRVTVTPGVDGVYEVRATVGGVALPPVRFGLDREAPELRGDAPPLEVPEVLAIHARAEAVESDATATDGVSGVASVRWQVGPFARVSESVGMGHPVRGPEQHAFDQVLSFRDVEPGPWDVDVVASDVAGNEVTRETRFHVADFAYGAGLLAADVPALQPVADLLATQRGGLATHFGTAFLGAWPLLPEAGERLARVVWSDLELAGDDLDDPDRMGFRAAALQVDLGLLGDVADAVAAAVDEGDWALAQPLVRRGALLYALVRDGWHFDVRRVLLGLDHAARQAELALLATYLGDAERQLRSLVAVGGPLGASADRAATDVHRIWDPVDQAGRFGFDPAPRGITDEQLIHATLALGVLPSTLRREEAASGLFADELVWLSVLTRWWIYEGNAAMGIAVHGAGRPAWPIYAVCQGLVDDARPLFESRDLEALTALFEDPARFCPCLGVYHCDFIRDEGEDDQDGIVDLPEACWDHLYRPEEWAAQPDRDRIRPECQLRE